VAANQGRIVAAASFGRGAVASLPGSQMLWLAIVWFISG
jgi:hypothetical protein